MHTYRPDVLEHLLRHGIRPTEHTRPDLVRDFVRDLYKYEICCLRERYMCKEFPKREYAGRVDALRRRYAVLSLHAREFVVAPPEGWEPARVMTAMVTFSPAAGSSSHSLLSAPVCVTARVSTT